MTESSAAVMLPVPKVAFFLLNSDSPPPEPASPTVRGIENLPDDVWDRFVPHRRGRFSGEGRGTYRVERHHDGALSAARGEE